VFELEDLRGREIEGQFYTEELVPVRITKQTTYKIDKILDKRVRRGIQEYLVRWKGYGKDFDSWVPTSDIVCVNTNMDRDHFYNTLFSNASQKIYPDNKIAALTIQLAKPITLDPAEIWEVGLCEISYPEIESVGVEDHSNAEVYCDRFCEVSYSEPAAGVQDKSNALLYCDLIAPQFIGSTMVRYLRTFNIVQEPESLGGEFLYENVYYVPVENRAFHNIRIELLKLFGKRKAFSKTIERDILVICHDRRSSGIRVAKCIYCGESTLARTWEEECNCLQMHASFLGHHTG